MALPLIPVLFGAAVGSLLTYAYTDKSSKKKIKEAVKNVTDKMKSFTKNEQKTETTDESPVN